MQWLVDKQFFAAMISCAARALPQYGNGVSLLILPNQDQARVTQIVDVRGTPDYGMVFVVVTDNLQGDT